jgi:hypothetical protein
MDWSERVCREAAALTNSLESYGRTSPVRTIRQFAEEDLVIPDGDYQGQLFRVHRQPVHGL